MLAFVVLILSSASATILIGDAVLGGKIFQLAKSKANVDLRTALQIWEGRLFSMRHVLEVASLVGSNPHALPENNAILTTLMNQGLFDFVGVADRDGAILAHAPALPGDLTVPRSFDVVTRALETNRPLVFPSLVPVGDVIRQVPNLSGTLDPFRGLGEILVVLAAAPLHNKEDEFVGSLFGGHVVNGSTDLVNRMVEAAFEGHRCADPPCAAATFFQHGTRVATSHPGLHRNDGYYIPLMTTADPEVIHRVLESGETYVGLAKVVGQDFYTAYSAIQDSKERVIGMLGIGTVEQEYRDARKRTTLLFAALIAGGMSFGFLMTYIFSVWLVRPIAELAQGMSRVAEGDLDYKVHIESADELRRLARAFNTMVKAVKDRDQKLREMTENRLSVVEKQISIGRLAAGVAHEINNPLTAVLSLSSLMLRHSPKEDARREDLEIIVAETTRCREIVSALLDFAREKPSTKIVVDVNQVVRDTLALANKYPSLGRVQIDFAPLGEPVNVLGDPTELQQVFTNLILNAAEATEERQEGLVSIRVFAGAGENSVHVRIRDNGKGIPGEHIDRVFEPFFTTKGKSKGTGLGLSVSLGIVQKHNGVIEVESEEGKGTTVTVILPVLTDEDPRPALSR